MSFDNNRFIFNVSIENSEGQVGKPIENIECRLIEPALSVTSCDGVDALIRRSSSSSIGIVLNNVSESVTDEESDLELVCKVQENLSSLVGKQKRGLGDQLLGNASQVVSLREMGSVDNRSEFFGALLSTQSLGSREESGDDGEDGGEVHCCVVLCCWAGPPPPALFVC